MKLFDLLAKNVVHNKIKHSRTVFKYNSPLVALLLLIKLLVQGTNHIQVQKSNLFEQYLERYCNTWGLLPGTNSSFQNHNNVF